MMGYVTVEKSELKMREFEIYDGYYCGVCKSIGKRYGQVPRMVLSYDAAFLAIMSSSLWAGEDAPAREHCMIHPFKKKTIVRNEHVDYAADMMLLLAWYKLDDDRLDDESILSAAAMKVFHRTYNKLRKAYPGFSQFLKRQLDQLHQLENVKCSNLDQIADAFAKIMEEMLMISPGAQMLSEAEKTALGRIGYHLGKWIYVIDALDDLEDDIIEENYNPLAERYGYVGELSKAAKKAAKYEALKKGNNNSDAEEAPPGGTPETGSPTAGAPTTEAQTEESASGEPFFSESSADRPSLKQTRGDDRSGKETFSGAPSDFREHIKPEMEKNLYLYLGEISKSLDLLPVKKYEEILKNVIYMGLNRKTENIIAGKESASYHVG